MARYFLLAEKPSVSRDIQAVYTAHRAEFADEIVFGAFHGHLMELAEPASYNPDWKKWNLDDLPIIPQSFVYEENDAESCKKIMDTIKNGHFDALINACDAGREGEHIFFSFYEAHKLSIPVLRFWASDTTEETILKTLKNLQSAAVFNGLREASKLRAQLDWLTGMNFSRAASLKTGKKMNIGRVLTPTLKIIVDREREIRNFQSKPFFEVQATFASQNGNYDGTYLQAPDYKNPRFDSKNEAEAIVNGLGNTGIVQSVESKQKATKAPTLYSIAELQKDGAKYFGYSADKTEALAQSLYEKRLTTYPRTESRFLPTAMVPELMKHIKPLEATPLKAYAAAVTQDRINSVTATKAYIDDAKITDHHAIIPTTQTPNFGELTKEEQDMYLLIAKRFLAIFMDPYIVENTTIVTAVGNAVFKTTGKVEVNKGFGVLYESKAKDVVLPKVTKGDQVSVRNPRTKEGKTTPPDRFNVATLLDAMMNAGQYVSSAESRKVLRETAGLGTGATRKDILSKLENTGMCEVKKTVFIPTEFGMALIDALGDRMIASPQMTADWEAKLQSLERGEYKGDLGNEIRSYVTEETMDIINKVNTNLRSLDVEAIGKCPCCGKQVIARKNFFCCEQYKNGCDFLIPMEQIGAKITKKDAVALLEGKSTGQKKMTTKSGKSIEDCFVLDKDYRVVPSFVVKKTVGDSPIDGNLQERKSLGTCPCCGGNVISGKSYYLCANKSVGNCDFVLGKTICGADISEKEVAGLLKGEESELHTFKWKSGKSGQAKFRLVKEKIEFIFPDRR